MMGKTLQDEASGQMPQLSYRLVQIFGQVKVSEYLGYTALYIWAGILVNLDLVICKQKIWWSPNTSSPSQSCHCYEKFSSEVISGLVLGKRTVFTLSIGTPQLLTITSTIYCPMLCLKIAGWVANSVDPDQVTCSAVSHLGQHCLPRPVCPNTYSKYGNIQKKIISFGWNIKSSCESSGWSTSLLLQYDLVSCNPAEFSVVVYLCQVLFCFVILQLSFINLWAEFILWNWSSYMI